MEVAHPSRIDDAVLALLAAHLFDAHSSWKGYGFDVMNHLHDAGYLFNPVGKRKSVRLTEEGMARGLELARPLSGAAETPGSGQQAGA
jgi:hypothetical protein